MTQIKELPQDLPNLEKFEEWYKSGEIVDVTLMLIEEFKPSEKDIEKLNDLREYWRRVIPEMDHPEYVSEYPDMTGITSNKSLAGQFFYYFIKGYDVSYEIQRGARPKDFMSSWMERTREDIRRNSPYESLGERS